VEAGVEKEEEEEKKGPLNDHREQYDKPLPLAINSSPHRPP
jgi:hypothetical protein